MSRTLITATSIHHSQGFVITKPLAQPKGKRRLRCVRVDTLKREIGRHLSDGHWVEDPLTGKRIKIYWRGLHRSQIWTLRRLRDRSDKLRQAYIPLEVFSGRRDGDLAKLEMWGLVKRLRRSARYADEKTRGQWMITKEGRGFLEGRRAIPPQVAVLLGEFIGHPPWERLITISDVTGDFDREQLERGRDGRVA